MQININTSFIFSDLKYNNYTKIYNNEKLFDAQINEYSNEGSLETSLINFKFPNQDIVITFEDIESFKSPKIIVTEHPVHRNEYALYFRFNPKFRSEPKLNLCSPMEIVNQEEIRGNFLFMIDRSGSMSGSRIEMAIKSLIYFLKSLPENSKFNILSFGSCNKLLFPDFIKANDKSIKQAIDVVKTFKADMGGTELIAPFDKIFLSLKNNLSNYKKEEIIRIFVLTDGSIYNSENLLYILSSSMTFFEKKDIDLRIYSLGIGNGCSEYLVKGIAQNGGGKSEFALNSEDIVEKVIYLLDNSMKKNLSNFKLYFEGNKTLNDSLQANSDIGGEILTKHKSFNETLEFFSKIEINSQALKNLNEINLIVSYNDVDKTEEKFCLPLHRNLLKDDDKIFKIWINNKTNKYFELYERNKNLKNNNINFEKDELNELSIKYQCLNRLTSLFMILKEKNLNEKDLKARKIVSMTNSDLIQLNQNGIYKQQPNSMEINPYFRFYISSVLLKKEKLNKVSKKKFPSNQSSSRFKTYK